MFSLLANIKYHHSYLKRPTYVTFLDYTAAFPSVHQERLLLMREGRGGLGEARRKTLSVIDERK